MQTQKRNQTNTISFVLEIIHANSKTKSDKYYIFCINTIKTPKQFTANQVIITMGEIIKDNKLVLLTEPKTIHFGLP